jgi:hypothetical protein
VAHSDNSATPVNIEKLVKLFKTHRCAMDFDSAFCKAVFLQVEVCDVTVNIQGGQKLFHSCYQWLCTRLMYVGRSGDTHVGDYFTVLADVEIWQI